MKTLKNLVLSFDDHRGVGENTFKATYDLIQGILGEDAAKVFKHYITQEEDGRYYLSCVLKEYCWKDITNAI